MKYSDAHWISGQIIAAISKEQYASAAQRFKKLSPLQAVYIFENVRIEIHNPQKMQLFLSEIENRAIAKNLPQSPPFAYPPQGRD